MSKKVILFELNEVPERVLDHFCAAHPNSTLSTLRRKSSFFRTFADGRLHPWATWPTVHRGVSSDVHTISHLGQNLTEIDKAYAPIWALLANNGAKVGVGGSLHSYPIPKQGKYAFYLPDTFATSPEAFPPELQAFQSFNLAMVSKSARNVDTGINFEKAKQLIPHLGRLGFTARTVTSIAGQVIGERIDSRKKLHRRTLQSVLAFDAFVRQLARTLPNFATFFTNHVASSMHRFWGAMFPDDFEHFGYDDSWVKSFGSEITVAMYETDRMIGRLKKFIDRHPEYMLLVAGSMGQAANNGEPFLSELTMIDTDRFMSVMGVPAGAWNRRPAMMPDYSFLVNDEYRAKFLSSLQRASVGRQGRKVEFEEREGGFIHVTLGMQNLEESEDRFHVGNEIFNFSDAGLRPVETDFQQGSTGYHIPQGIFMVYDPQSENNVSNQEISISDIAPSILRKFGLSVPDYMNGSNLLN